MAITGQNGIWIGDGVGGYIDYDIINGRVLGILANGSLGLYATALIENPGQVRAGTVVYRKVEMIKTGSFAVRKSDGTGGIVQQQPQVSTVLVNLIQNSAAMYKLDDFDLAALQSPGEIEAQISHGLSKSTMARLDAELFENIKTFLKTAPAGTVEVIPNFSTTTVIEEMRLNRMKLNDMIADIESQITPEMVGTTEFNTTTIVNKKAYARFLEGIAQSGGSMGTELRLGGQLPGQLIGGNAILKHIFIGKNVDSTILTLDKVLPTDFDFSKIEALLWSKDAIAFPTDFVSISSMRDQFDGNLIFIQKFRYGFKVLRPELIRAIVNANITRDAESSIKLDNGVETVSLETQELIEAKGNLTKIEKAIAIKNKELDDLKQAINKAHTDLQESEKQTVNLIEEHSQAPIIVKNNKGK